MPESWTINFEDTTATVTGRELVPLSKKLNPIWWFKNDVEQNLSTAEWYMPDSPQWLRQLCWECRNPLQNFRCFVLGVQDRNYTVTGRAPVMTVQRDDLSPPERGWQWCKINTAIPLWFVSYCGRYIIFQFGWQPNGFFGCKINPAVI